MIDRILQFAVSQRLPYTATADLAPVPFNHPLEFMNGKSLFPADTMKKWKIPFAIIAQAKRTTPQLFEIKMLAELIDEISSRRPAQILVKGLSNNQVKVLIGQQFYTFR